MSQSRLQEEAGPQWSRPGPGIDTGEEGEPGGSRVTIDRDETLTEITRRNNVATVP